MSDRRQWTLPARREPARLDFLLPETPSMVAVRSRGEVRLGFAHRAGRTRAYETFQSGCLRARMVTAPAEAPCAVLLNTSGGLTGGDRLSQSARWRDGAAACVTTQAAEKIYRALAEPALIETSLDVDDHCAAEWLPQETIVFDRARLSRRVNVRLTAQSSFLAIEALVFGRAAMDERMNSGEIRDAWRIHRDGRLIFAETLHLQGAVDQHLQRKAIGDGARASAIIIHAAPDAASRLDRLRDAFEDAQGRCVASAWSELLVARLLAPDGETLRADALTALNIIRDGKDMPRVWAC
ncbi:MAG: urease accessory protein UreD [Caulobacterales bacterium]